MAKKRPEKPEVPAAATEPTIKPVRLDLAEDLHRLLRKVAAEHGVSMAAYARDIVEKAIRSEAKDLGFK